MPNLVSWPFFIDLVVHYLPEEPDKLEKTAAVEEPVAPHPDEAAPGTRQ